MSGHFGICNAFSVFYDLSSDEQSINFENVLNRKFETYNIANLRHIT